MSEKKKSVSRPDDGAGDAPASVTPSDRFDLLDVLAIGVPVELPITPGDYAPVPVTLLGVDFAIRRRYTGSEVKTFFGLLRTKGVDVSVEVLDKVLTEGDPQALWGVIGELSIYESNKLFEGIYKIAGLMSPSGKFLAS